MRWSAKTAVYCVARTWGIVISLSGGRRSAWKSPWHGWHAIMASKIVNCPLSRPPPPFFLSFFFEEHPVSWLLPFFPPRNLAGGLYCMALFHVSRMTSYCMASKTIGLVLRGLLLFCTYGVFRSLAEYTLRHGWHGIPYVRHRTPSPSSCDARTVSIVFIISLAIWQCIAFRVSVRTKKRTKITENRDHEKLLLRLPSDNVQHDLQRWSLRNIPRKKTKGTPKQRK